MAERTPSSTQLESGTIEIQDIKIQDVGTQGGLVTWKAPASQSGGFTTAIISDYHAELIDGSGTMIAGSRSPAGDGNRSPETSASFADYPNNTNYPHNIPKARIKIVTYGSDGIARSSIIIEDIAIKDDWEGILSYVSRLPRRLIKFFQSLFKNRPS